LCNLFRLVSCPFQLGAVSNTAINITYKCSIAMFYINSIARNKPQTLYNNVMLCFVATDTEMDVS